MSTSISIGQEGANESLRESSATTAIGVQGKLLSHPQVVAGRLGRSAGVGVALTSLFLLLLPNQSRDLARTAASVLLVGWPILAHRQFAWRRLLGAATIPIFGGWWLCIESANHASASVGACLLLLGLGHLWTGGGAAARGLSIGAAVLGVLWATHQTWLWLLPPASSPFVLWSRALGGLFDQNWNIGPTYQGWQFLGICAIFLFGRFVLVERSWVQVALGGLLLVAISGLQMGLLHRFGARLDTSQLFQLAWIGAAPPALLAMSLLVGSASEPAAIREGAPSWFAVVCTSLAAALALAIAGLSDGSLTKTSPRVLFYAVNEGPILDWDKPRYGAYGPYSLGIYGLLVEYLRADGYQVDFLREPITPEALQGCDAFATINANSAWSEEELLAVWNFVDGGGSLIVLGDHTGVDGSLVPQNDLLAPFGIKFRFDSGFPACASGWGESLLAAHPALAQIENAGNLGTAVGASLELSGWSAEPLLFAPHALSDHGVPDDEQRNYLGDYRYQTGERLGDNVLVAWARHGHGRVVVHGDTSGFQNALIGQTFEPYVRGLFAWATGSPLVYTGTLVPRLAGLAALIFGLWAVLLGRQRALVGAAVVVLLLTSGSVARAQVARLLQRSPLSLPTIAVDESHIPRIEFGASMRRGLDGFENSAQRSGYRLRRVKRLNAAEIEGASILLSVAPMRPYGAAEVDLLMGFMDAGGFVIACASHPESEGLVPLLERVGLHVTPRLIGPIPLDRAADRPRLQIEYTDAWEVAASGFDPSAAPWVYGVYGKRPLSLLTRHGRGGLFLVGDSAFFGSQNLETHEYYSEPNILFLRGLLADIEELRSEEPR